MTFHNLTPAIPGFYSDPTMCVGADAVYLSTSSFEYFPGDPVFRTEDMAEFVQVGNALDRRDQLDLSTFAGASAGLFAATLRYHDGLYWLITTNIAQIRQGAYIMTATDPAGPWSDPLFVPGVLGIDPDIAWDEAGTCYVTFAGGPMGILQRTIDPLTGESLSETRQVWTGTGMKAPEGPHLYRRGAWWYLMIAEGGTERGHCVTVARSERPDGGFVSNPANPILTHRSTEHPVQNVGHADLVEWKGAWWACYHGVRPHGRTPEYHVIGRETMVCPVEWVDDWPVFREDLAATHTPETSLTDDFTGPLGPRWVSPQGDLSTVSTGSHGLTMSPGRPVTIRVQDHDWSAEADLDVTQGSARLLVYLDDEHWYGLEAGAQTVRAVAQVGPFHQVLGETTVTDPGHVTVRLGAAVPAAAEGRPAPEPDRVSFAVLDRARSTELGVVDGRYLSTEVAGGFTGRVVGVQCLDGTVRVGEFRYRPTSRA